MASQFFDKLAAEIPMETRIFVKKYMDFTERVEALMAKKGINQQQLAEALQQHPSAITRWLKKEQNLTLKTIAKLEAFFEEEILVVQGATPQAFNVPPKTGTLLQIVLVKPAANALLKPIDFETWGWLASPAPISDTNDFALAL
jgi:transcriptional regulator with XRE-family HTH domain